MTEPSILNIRSMGALGDGLADGGVFAPLTLPGERIVARVENQRAEVVDWIETSPDRVVPPCPHFGDCGGCVLQQWASAPYLDWKVGMVRQALGRAGLNAEMCAPYVAPAGSRRRLGLHARRHGRGALLGFKARRSWRLAPIEVCTIAEERLVAALPLLRRLAAPFFEHPKSAPTLHVTVTDTGLDIDISGVERRKDGLSADARARAAEIAGEGDIARVTMAGETLYQARPALIRMGKATVALPPGGFLQAVAAAEQAMVDFALQASLGARRVADLYCGVGAFTFPLAGLAPVMAADASAPAVASLRAALATAPGLSPIEAAVRDLDRRPVLADELRKIDVVLFDPPRAGAAAQSAEIARSKVPRAIAVSCNLTTFVRDARILIEGGFELERILPVDQFLWSPHIELVGLFNR